MTEEIKASAARLYESCVFDQLLGETLRPGGLELTARLAQIADINEDYTVLDMACGKGTTAFFLAREYNCRVIGIDLSTEMLASCRAKAEGEKLADRVSFLMGDGECLPFNDSSFDVVITECYFSLLSDKKTTARGIHRVLKPGGMLVMADMTLRGEVSEELRSQVTFPCCLAGAWRVEEYTSLLEQIGFQSPYMEDHSKELLKVAYQLGITFGSIDKFLGQSPVRPCRRKGTGDSSTSIGPPTSIESYQEFVKLGKPGYALIVATKVVKA